MIADPNTLSTRAFGCFAGLLFLAAALCGQRANSQSSSPGTVDVYLVSSHNRYYAKPRFVGQFKESGLSLARLPSLPSKTAGYLCVAEGRLSSRIDAEHATMRRLDSVELKVRCKGEDGKPVRGIRITATAVGFLPSIEELEDSGPWLAGTDPRCAVYSSLTDEDGAAVVRLPSKGRFTVYAWHQYMAIHSLSGIENNFMIELEHGASPDPIQLTMRPIRVVAAQFEGDVLLRSTETRAKSGRFIMEKAQWKMILRLVEEGLDARLSSAFALTSMRMTDQPVRVVFPLEQRGVTEVELVPQLLSEMVPQILTTADLPKPAKVGTLVVDVSCPDGRTGESVGDCKLKIVYPDRKREIRVSLTPGKPITLPPGRYRLIGRRGVINARYVVVQAGKATRTKVRMISNLHPVHVTANFPWHRTQHPAGTLKIIDANGIRWSHPAWQGSPDVLWLPQGETMMQFRVLCMQCDQHKVSVEAGSKPVSVGLNLSYMEPR